MCDIYLHLDTTCYSIEIIQRKAFTSVFKFINAITRRFIDIVKQDKIAFIESAQFHTYFQRHITKQTGDLVLILTQGAPCSAFDAVSE